VPGAPAQRRRRPRGSRHGRPVPARLFRDLTKKLQDDHPVIKEDAPAISRELTVAMATAAGIAAADIYYSQYSQPMLGIMERDLGSPGLAGLIPTAIQLGYAAGLFLLVPLGDLMDRPRPIVVQFTLLALALALVALAPSAGLMMLALLALGACSTVAQQAVPFTAALARPASRCTTIGTVMPGCCPASCRAGPWPALPPRTLAGRRCSGWRRRSRSA